MSGLHVYGNLGLHLLFSSTSFELIIAPKFLAVTWLTLLVFFQKNTSQVSGELFQLKEEMATSKANFEKKIKDLEANLAKAASEILS